MDESDFEGTLVLEQVAGIGRLEDFFEAIDVDDFAEVVSIMKAAKLDAPTIAMVAKKMNEGGEH